MLDITLIREQPDFVRDELAKKGYAVDFSVFLERDAKRRQLIYETERLKAEKNQTSAQIPQLKKSGQDVAPLLARMKEINETIKSGDEQISHLNTVQKAFLDALPNLPADDVLPGGKENNQVVRSVGKRPEFSFQPQHHVDLCERLGLIDYKSGARLGGSGFWVYRKLGAQLEWTYLK